MARPTRDVRRRSFSIGQAGAGDYVVVIACVVLFFALVINWWANTISGSVNAVDFSELYFVVTLILILLTVALLAYPLAQSEMGLRPLPVATPPLIMAVGGLILLTTTYELGRYTGVNAVAISAGFGVWLAWVCSWIYLAGAVIKWGSRQRKAI